MSSPATPAGPQSGARRELVFGGPTALFNFLLTCLEEGELAPGSPAHDRCLNQVHVPLQPPQTFLIDVHAPPGLTRLMEQMAVANGGRAQDARKGRYPPEQFHTLTVDRLLRGVPLRPAPPRRAGHVLVALRGRNAEAAMVDCARHAWNLGARGVEVGFARDAAGAPACFVRVNGLRHADAFLGWGEGADEVELYAPTDAARPPARFYVRWGYRFPVPGLERLCGLDSELVLLRPAGAGTKVEWQTFGPGQLNFFRKPQEVFEVRADVAGADAPVTELRDDAGRGPVPLEVAVVPRARPGANRVWLIDGEIDRQRRGLHDLERRRARLASGEADEVYFAYRFEQEGEDRLNPLLARLMQGGLGTLAGYDYAFCRPEAGPPFHLVVANRTQRQLGFALQLADRVFYQPAQWRRWGVNLFLPAGTELSPRIDGPDAVALLQRLLDAAGPAAGEGEAGRPLADYPAVLWEPGGEGCIRETRVRKTAPLLDQYRLLNSFQRVTAGEVAAATRQRLAEGLRAARGAVAGELDEAEAKLVEYFAARTEAMEGEFTGMEEKLRAADDLVTRVGPRVETVSNLVRNLPAEWADFVDRVVKTNKEVRDPDLAAAARLGDRARHGRDDLRALSARNRDVAAAARASRDRLAGQIDACGREAEENAAVAREVEDIARRVVRLVREVTRLHDRLGHRVRQVEAAEKRAEQMQAEIDRIADRERAVRARLAELTALRAEAAKTEQRVRADEARAEAEQQKLLARAEELARRREELRAALGRPVEQLKQIERHLEDVAACTVNADSVFGQLREQVDMIQAHADAVRLWEKQREVWAGALEGRRTRLAEQVRRMGAAIGPTGYKDEQLGRAAELVWAAEAILQSVEPSDDQSGPAVAERP